MKIVYVLEELDDYGNWVMKVVVDNRQRAIDLCNDNDWILSKVPFLQNGEELE
jgi:hypothetical protein